MILLLDCDDSFVRTLAGYLAELNGDPLVVEARGAKVRDLLALRPDGILLSPGPGAPCDWALAVDLVRVLPAGVPLLGVCLGHQCIGAAFGAEIEPIAMPQHGVASAIRHDGAGIFAGLPDPAIAARYHSLAISRTTLPADLHVSAVADDGVVMGIRHRNRPIEGVQFHPESILTRDGHRMLANFFALPFGA